MSSWRPNNRMTWKMVAVSFLAAAIAFCLFQLAASRAAHAGNHLSSANPTSKSSSNPLAAPAGTTYTWNGLVNNNWTVPANWTPIRAPTATSDILVFDGSSTPSPTVTNVPTEEIAELDLTNGALVTLKAETTVPAGDKTLTVSGGAGADRLKVPAGTSLTISGTTILNVSLAPNTTALVGGNVGLLNAAHKLTAASANAIKFASPSIFAAGHPSDTGFSGSPFGSGTDGSVVFQNGSSANFNEGSDPFGGNGHSVATFNLGSSQSILVSSAFLSDGRTYGSLTLGGNQSYSGSGAGLLTIFNTLTIASGSTLTLSGSSGGDLNLLGDIAVNGTLTPNGRTVMFQGGNATQNVTTAATFGDVSISKIGGSVKLGGTLTINGALQFDGTSSSVVDVLDLNANNLNLNGTVGGTSSSTANGFKGDATGATLNIGGTGALGTLKFVSGSQILKSLSVNRTNSGTVTMGSNLTVAGGGPNLILTNGVIDAGSNTLSLAAVTTISRTNGYVIGNLQKVFVAPANFTFTVGTANGYSPVDANVTAAIGTSLTVKAVQGRHPNIGGTTALQRYWTLSNSGSVTADLTFHYLASDIAGIEANYKIFKYNGSFTQFTPNVLDTTNHSAKLNSVSSFSDWTLDNLPTLSINNVSVNEGTGAGTTDFTFTVTKTGSTPLTPTVNFATAPGTTNPATSGGSCGSSGVDYQSQSSSLTFLPADTTKTITVLVCKDAVFEADETFFVNLSGETNATLTKNQGVGTILNDDDPPTTIVVNSTNDVDDTLCDATHCSLREAINLANITPNAVTINFAIAAGDSRHFYYKDDGSGSPNGTVSLANIAVTTASNDASLPADKDPDWPHSWWSILPTSALPAVTQTVVIDGYTQTGATVNTLATSDNAVLRIELDGASAGGSVTGLTLSGGNSVLRGLAINRFTGNGVNLQAAGSSVTGNFIGADVSGTLNLGNTLNGVSCTGNSMTIGGSVPARANLISGNNGDGILITNSNSNLIQGNFIGTKANATNALGNSGSGINFSGSSSASNTVGGVNAGEGNTIAFNGADGVRLADSGTGNTIRGNSIFSNGSTANDLGIDLGADGVTANDSKDPDTGPNNLQNFPVITRAVTGTTNIIQGTLNSTPGQMFTIDFYANASCDTLGGNGEGKTYLGTVTTAATDGTTGDVPFTFNPGSLTVGQVITATATDSTGNTSEFSKCFTAVAGAAGTIQFAAANTNDTETNSGSHTANVAVTRSGGDGAVSVNYAVTNGTATTADNDYSISPSTGTLTWVDQDTSTKFISVTVNGDTKVELDETVNLTLSSATGGATIGGTNPATLTIVNDDCVTSLTVNNNGDAGDASPGDGVCETASGNGTCTLRAAIQEANAAGSFCGAININFSGVASPINLATALPDINRNVNINGPGANLLTVQRSSASNFRIFTINSGKTVTISALTISNGNVPGDGGGVRNSGTLTMTNCNIFGSTAPSGGGGVSNAAGSLTLNSCNIGGTLAGQANAANAGNGGGVLNLGGTLTINGGSIVGNSGGGIVVSLSTATLNKVAITNNTSSAEGGGIGMSPFGSANIINCVIAGNTAGTSGGGIFNNGGTLTLVNSTISGNSASGSGGGVSYPSGPFTSGVITLTNDTVTNNRSDSDNSGAEQGGGISRAAGTVRLKNTIVAGNFRGTGSTVDDINGIIDTNNSSFNLIGTGGSGGLTSSNNQVGVANPLLGPLANNGGPTMTHALLPGSPAINAGSNANLPADTFDLDGDSNTAEPLPVDQRGVGFARVINTTVDIGAFESRGFTIAATSGTPQSATINTAFSLPLVATVSSAFGEPVSGGLVTFTAPASGASVTFPGGVITTNVAINGSGVATSPIFTANSTAGGPYNVIASIGAGQPTAAFALTNLKAVTSTAVSSSVNPSAPGQSVTFTATVSSSAGTPTGTVQFKDGGANLGAAQTLNASGVATFSTSSLTVGTHIITAEYSGDANFAASTGTLSGGQVVGSIINFSSANYSVNESDGFVIVTVNRTGDTSGAVTVNYATSDDSDANPLVPCAPTNPPGAVASSRCDFTTALGTVKFAAGEGSKNFRVLITQDSYAEGAEGFTITLSNLTGAAVLSTPSTATVTINNVAPASPGNAIDDTDIFVRQHYHDFLNREADTSGLNFWKNEITSCGSNAQCVEVKRINVSASFFLSIEFQQTGFLVERIYKAAYGDADGSSAIGEAHPLKVPVVRFLEFLSDSQQISQGVVVLQPGWDTVLEKNKSAFAADFVQRQRFASMYQTTMKPDVFVDALFANTGVTPSTADRDAAIGEFGSAMTTTDMAARGRALQRVAENDMLATQEFNRAFVLMEYFGYLRRNPNNLPDSDYSGYVFWLTKLNQFNGNYINAEMVKAFLSSTEYRQRFGP